AVGAVLDPVPPSAGSGSGALGSQLASSQQAQSLRGPLLGPGDRSHRSSARGSTVGCCSLHSRRIVTRIAPSSLALARHSGWTCLALPLPAAARAGHGDDTIDLGPRDGSCAGSVGAAFDLGDQGRSGIRGGGARGQPTQGRADGALETGRTSGDSSGRAGPPESSIEPFWSPDT